MSSMPISPTNTTPAKDAAATTNPANNSNPNGSDSKDSFDVDVIIEKLLEVRGKRPGKNVNLTESEIKQLCIRSKDIFISQPILLELEAPIKIVGDIHGMVIKILLFVIYLVCIELYFDNNHYPLQSQLQHTNLN
jgi:hypothetical protein